MARALGIFALVLLAGNLYTANAWSYVGCFTRSKLSVQEEGAGKDSGSCVDSCWNAYGLPLGVLSGDGQCECTGLIPHTDAQVADEMCTGTFAATLARLYYRNIADTTTSCRLAPVAVASSSFNMRADQSDAVRYFPNNTMALALKGTAGTTVTGLYPTGYGMYSLMMNINMKSGVVSAFYTTSDPNTEFKEKDQRDQDEIDVEFINAHPAPSAGCIWTNTWVEGKVMGPSHCGDIIQLDTWRTYTVDWQPDNITWYLDGDKIDQRDKNNGTLPRKESVTAFSIWTMDHVDFGGVAPGGTEWSYFSDLRRLLCDDVRVDPAAGAPATAATPPPTTSTAPNATTTAALNATTKATGTTSATTAVVTPSVNVTRNGGAAAGPVAAAALLGALLALLAL